MAHEPHDHYFHQARRDGYRSRAAYKLVEIDDRKRIIRRGDRVLDCGAAPGSWLQVAARRVGDRGYVVGIDLKPIDRLNETNVTVVQGDLREIEAGRLLEVAELDAASGERFDVLLSDMAPYTTGEHLRDHHRSVRLCEAVLDRAPDLLRPGGNLVMKVFEGEAYPALLERTRRMFDAVKGFKPKASRDASTEMYVIAHGYRGGDGRTAADIAAAESLPKRRPSSGWG